jgi:hypothetical protein
MTRDYWRPATMKINFDPNGLWLIFPAQPPHPKARGSEAALAGIYELCLAIYD